MTDQKTTLEVGGLHWATSQSVIENGSPGDQA